MPDAIRSWRPASCILLLLLASGVLPAATSQVWETTEYAQFVAGKLENLSVQPEGALVIAPVLDTVFSSDQPLIWSVAAAPDGSLFVGTGHQGNVYRIGPKGNSTLLWSAPEIEVFALAVASDGDVFAGTSPNGKVYRIDNKGQHEVYFDPEQTYIWSLAFAQDPGKDKAPDLFVGTGDKGKVYRVSSRGKGELYYESGQRHVVSLALDGQGRLLAGTDPNGILYRIESKRKAFALYDSDMPEIRNLQVTPEGAIFAAGVGGGYSSFGGDAGASFGTAQGAATTTITVTASVGNDPKVVQKPGAQTSGTTQPQSAVSVSQPVITVAGIDRSELLRIGSDLQVEKVWKSDSEGLLALTLPGADRAGVLFATDKQGRIYSVNQDGQVTLETQTGQDEITQLVTSGGERWVATAHAGNLLRFGSEPSKTGSYLSVAHDAKSAADWGRLSWQGRLPNGTAIEFRTRSGNSAKPDAGWSDWSEPVAVEEGTWRGGPITSPPARYVQWQARLNGRADSSPTLTALRLTYLPRNRAPRVDSIKVSATSDQDTSLEEETSTADTTSAYSITVTDTGSVSSTTSTESTDAFAGGPQRRLKITWTATDPDGDDLLAAVRFRGDGESAWKLVKDEIEEKSLLIDSDTLADGTYRFRVEVSDGRSNPPDKARTALRTSEPVIVDHTPPVVRLLGIDDRQVIRFAAQDAGSMLRQAEYSIDAGRWVPVLADDGVIDSQKETFTIRLDKAADHERLVTLRVRDRGSNAGLGKAVVK